MGLELIYTSARKGLKPGSLGFCTVAMSRQMSPNLTAALESLSGYRHLFMAGHAGYAQNPVNFCHYLVPDRGRLVRVIARISSAPADYTGRTNKLAHFMVLDATELAAAGPAWLLQKPSLMMEVWSGEPRWIDNSPPIPTGNSIPARCATWERVTGDAGWAGDLLQRFCDQPDAPVHILCNPGTPMLDLFAEALALLPPEARWQIAFSTYFTGLPVAGIKCHWRGVIAGNPMAEGTLDPKSIIDLTRPKPQAPGGPCHQAARLGKLIDLSQLRIPFVNRGDSATAGHLPNAPTRKPDIGMNATPDVFDLAPVLQQDNFAKSSFQLSNPDESRKDQYPRRRPRWILPTVLGSAALIIILTLGLLLAPRMLRSLAQLHQAMVTVGPPISAKKTGSKIKARAVATRPAASTNPAGIPPSTATTKPAVNTQPAAKTKPKSARKTKPATGNNRARSTKPIFSAKIEPLAIKNYPLIFASPPAGGLVTDYQAAHPIPTQGAANFLVRFPHVPTEVGKLSLAGTDAKITVLTDGKLYNVKVQPGRSIYVRWARNAKSGAGLSLFGSKKYVTLARIKMPGGGRTVVIKRMSQRNGAALPYLRQMVIDLQLNHGQTDRIQFLTGADAPKRVIHPRKIPLNNTSPSTNHIELQGGSLNSNLFPNIRLVMESLRPSYLEKYAHTEHGNHSFLIQLNPSEHKDALKFWVKSDDCIRNNYKKLARKLNRRISELRQQIKKETKKLVAVKNEIGTASKEHIKTSKKTAILEPLKTSQEKYASTIKLKTRKESEVANYQTILKSLRITFRVELYLHGPVLERFIFKGAGK